MPSETLTQISKTIRPIMNRELGEIVYSHMLDLVHEPLDYIVQAVWGPKKPGKLTPVEQRINSRVQTVVDEVIRSLDISDLKDTQKFAVEFLLRELILHKILFMINVLKDELESQINGLEVPLLDLDSVDPWGSA